MAHNKNQKTITLQCKQVIGYKQEVQVTDAEFEVLHEALKSGDTITQKDHPTAFLIIQEKIDTYLVLNAAEEYTEVAAEMTLSSEGK